MTNALTKVDRELPLATTSPQQGLTIEAAFRAVVEGDMNSEKLAVMKDLLAMNAEQAFNAAFVALQSEMPVIVASSVIPNRGKYERFEDVMNVIGPLLIKNGFSVSFEQFADDKRIRVTCHLRHVKGHSVATPFAVRLGGRADSDTQADCKASTTAKRNALLQAINIVIRQDCLSDEENDARIEGGNVSEDVAFELERRVRETNSDVASFLKFAGGVKSFKEIPASRYDELDQLLRRKEKAR